MTTLTSPDLVADLQELERQLRSFSAPSAAEQAVRDLLAARRAELAEIQRLEYAASAEHQHAQEQAALVEVEDAVKRADALCSALRSELHILQQRLAQAEFQRAECLRAVGKIRAQLGVN
jgi:hypothetical protein